MARAKPPPDDTLFVHTCDTPDLVAGQETLELDIPTTTRASIPP
jgi:hypothetical protein